jgi:IS5 family transposase
MIVDRYEAVDLCELIPELRLEMESELRELDRLLSDDELFASVRADLSKRYPNSVRLGRHSTPVEVILRMLVLRRLYDWSYEVTERNVSDSLVLRQFTRLYLEAVPDDTTLIRWAALIGGRTLERINDRAVELARTLRVTRGRKLRTDGTVVETNIRHPTDSSLLSDSVRVVGRLLRRAKAVVDTAMGEAFRDRAKSAKRLARSIAETARRRGAEAEAARKDAYRRLLKVAGSSLKQARKVRELLGEESAGLREELARCEELVGRVVSQARRRVLEGESVPATEKVVSIFEPHTAIIRRGKAGKDTEYGRKVWLDEVEGGIVSGYRVLVGNPPDQEQLRRVLDNHKRLFGKPPELVAADRGVYSADNERAVQEAGVKQAVLPKPGRVSPQRRVYERQGWFRRGMRWRAGAEGRISVMKRRGYLGRCRDKGEEGFGRWVGWGVLTANLSTIARTVAAR